jgi:hypothetical protein
MAEFVVGILQGELMVSEVQSDVEKEKWRSIFVSADTP